MNKKILLKLQLPLVAISPAIAISCNRTPTTTTTPTSINVVEDKIENVKLSDGTLLKYNGHNVLGNKKLNREFSANYEVGKVKKIELKSVSDGDTIASLDGKKFRFHGCDTPETHKYLNDGTVVSTTGPQYEYGHKAELFTKFIVESDFVDEVIVAPIKTRGGTEEYTDKYGRVVAIIYIKTKSGYYINLTEQLIYWGYAIKRYISRDPSDKFYTHEVDYYNLIVESSQHAKDNKLGVYAQDAPYDEIY